MAGLGQTFLEDQLARAADRVMERLTPKIAELATRASEAAKPMVSEIVRKDVMPWATAALVAGAAVAAAIGAWFATRRR